MAEIVHIRPELQRRKPIVRAEVLRRIFEEHELFEDTTVRALIKSADAIGKLPKDSNNYTNERSVCFAEEGTRILLHALVRHLASEMDRKALARVIKEVKHNETR